MFVYSVSEAHEVAKLELYSAVVPELSALFVIVIVIKLLLLIPEIPDADQVSLTVSLPPSKSLSRTGDNV